MRMCIPSKIATLCAMREGFKQLVLSVNLSVSPVKNFEDTFADCSLVPTKRHHTPNFAEKITTIPQNSQKFSPSKVSRYTVLYCLLQH